MKYVKVILVALVCGLFVVGNVSALTVDTLMYKTELPNSSESVELDWVNSVLTGDTFYFGYKLESLEEVDWISEGIGVYSYGLSVPYFDYFIVKVGNTIDGDTTYFLFYNEFDVDYAIVNLTDMGFEKTDNITGISHITSLNNVAPVPEPSTFLILGTGLIGLGIARRKSIFNKDKDSFNV